jgi:hypothetical protein
MHTYIHHISYGRCKNLFGRASALLGRRVRG